MNCSPSSRCSPPGGCSSTTWFPWSESSACSRRTSGPFSKWMFPRLSAATSRSRGVSRMPGAPGNRYRRAGNPQGHGLPEAARLQGGPRPGRHGGPRPDAGFPDLRSGLRRRCLSYLDEPNAARLVSRFAGQTRCWLSRAWPAPAATTTSSIGPKPPRTTSSSGFTTSQPWFRPLGDAWSGAGGRRKALQSADHPFRVRGSRVTLDQSASTASC